MRSDSAEQVLQIVENEQGPPVEGQSCMGGEHVCHRPVVGALETENVRQRGADTGVVLDSREAHERHAARKGVDRVQARLYRQPRLPASTGPAQRQQPHVVSAQQLAEGGQVVTAPDQRGARDRHRKCRGLRSTAGRHVLKGVRQSGTW